MRRQPKQSEKPHLETLADWGVCLAVLIEKVSVRSLRKTGIFPSQAGDFREILAKVAQMQRQNG
jgi:hypothetical protein